MGLNVTLSAIRVTDVYSSGITHNLNQMAEAAKIYEALWRPEEIGITTADQLIPILTEGLRLLESDPGYYRTFAPSNGWGTYDGLVRFVKGYLAACIESPDATVTACR